MSLSIHFLSFFYILIQWQLTMAFSIYSDIHCYGLYSFKCLCHCQFLINNNPSVTMAFSLFLLLFHNVYGHCYFKYFFIMLMAIVISNTLSSCFSHYSFIIILWPLFFHILYHYAYGHYSLKYVLSLSLWPL